MTGPEGEGDGESLADGSAEALADGPSLGLGLEPLGVGVAGEQPIRTIEQASARPNPQPSLLRPITRRRIADAQNPGRRPVRGRPSRPSRRGQTRGRSKARTLNAHTRETNMTDSPAPRTPRSPRTMASTTKPAPARKSATKPAAAAPAKAAAERTAATQRTPATKPATRRAAPVVVVGGPADDSRLAIHQGGIGALNAEDVAVSQGGVGALRAQRLTVEMGGVGAAMTNELDLRQGIAGAVIARDARFEQAGVRTLIANRVHFGPNSGAGVVLAAHVDGDVRTLFDWRGALAFGAAAGAVISLFRLRRR